MLLAEATEKVPEGADMMYRRSICDGWRKQQRACGVFRRILKGEGRLAKVEGEKPEVISNRRQEAASGAVSRGAKRC